LSGKHFATWDWSRGKQGFIDSIRSMIDNPAKSNKIAAAGTEFGKIHLGSKVVRTPPLHNPQLE